MLLDKIKKLDNKVFSLIYLVPSLVVFLFVYIYPMTNSLVLSFTKWNLSIPGSTPKFVGFENYTEILKSNVFWNSLLKTILFVVIVVSIQLLLGLFLAVFYSANLRFIGFFRMVLIVPLMMTPVVAGTLFRMIFNSKYGVFNYFINLLGIPSQNWLAASLAFTSILLVEIWQYLPFVVFILSAGMLNLSISINEAAKVDGASKWQIFRYITIPLLKPVIIIVVLLRIMDAFKVFDTLFTLTGGGPGSSTELLSILIYKNGWNFFQLGTASSYSWIFLIIVFISTIFLIKNIYKVE